MKIIISPAKKMKENDAFCVGNQPKYLDKTEILKKYIQDLSLDEAIRLWQCSHEIGCRSKDFFQDMVLDKGCSPALVAYEGIAYQYMAPQVFNDMEWHYVEKHLRLLSGFYGMLKPSDGIVPYRLEMKNKVKVDGFKDLYDFWGDLIYKELYQDNDWVLNLASKEYSMMIEKYLQPKDRFVNVDFLTKDKDKITTKATFAKMARGEMVRYLAENNIESVEGIKGFNRQGFVFNKERSDKNQLVFIKDTSR